MIGAKQEATQRIDEPSIDLDSRDEVQRLRRALDEAQARLERAEAANRAKDRFLATLSHELRTPLNAMLGWAQMLATDDLDEATRVRAIRSIERNAKLQAQLIDDLMDISRIISGKLKIDVRPVEVKPLVGSAVENFKQQAGEKGIELILQIPQAECVISGDPNRLQQVIGNLLANAIKFTSRGGRVVVAVSEAGSRRDLVRISVADDGRGIEPALLPHIFERFRQGDVGSEQNARSGGGGLGLGLTIARHLVELQGGVIRAESDGLGRGSTFSIELPAFDGDGRRALRRYPSLAPCASDRLSVDVLAGVAVLVVDDEPDAQELIATMLQQFGAQVTRASSAAEAFSRFVELQPDVLVSDIAMPGEDGHSLIRRVRQHPHERERPTPAIAVTAHATKQDRERAIEAGFDRHLAKPIETVDLVGTVASLAGRA